MISSNFSTRFFKLTEREKRITLYYSYYHIIPIIYIDIILYVKEMIMKKNNVKHKQKRKEEDVKKELKNIYFSNIQLHDK